MTSKRIFYRTIISIEVLSEKPLHGDESLSDIEYLITEGPCSGQIKTISENEPVNGPQMARLLEDQASDVTFFGLDAAGNNLNASEEPEPDVSGRSA